MRWPWPLKSSVIDEPFTPAPYRSQFFIRPYDLLLLDFGGVCLLNPAELNWLAEEKLGLEPGTFTWKGPLDPSTDEPWRKVVAGTGLTEREYWEMRAREVGAAAGREMSVTDYMKLLYDPPGDHLIRIGCMDVVEKAYDAGIRVAILANDLNAFHSPEWQDGIELLQSINLVIDCSDIGYPKPDRRAFDYAMKVLKANPAHALFVDDQPGNVDGGMRAGIDSVVFDVTDPTRAWTRVARSLGVLY